MRHDAATFDALWAEHIGLIMRYAHATAERWGVGVDLMLQAARTELWRTMGTFRSDRGVQFSTYFVRCIRGRMMQWARADRGLTQRAQRSFVSIDQPIDETEETIGDRLEAPESDSPVDYQALSKALRELPAPLVEAVRLYYFEQLSLEAAGRRLGITLQGVACRLRNARHLLCNKLSK